jgi:hypothetical protein
MEAQLMLTGDNEPDLCPAEWIFWKGVFHCHEGDITEGRLMYERAAAMGEVKAMINLGGLELDAGRVEAARAWFERAADLGDPWAFSNCGTWRGLCEVRLEGRLTQGWRIKPTAAESHLPDHSRPSQPGVDLT